jgi:cytosine/adenosine deaminase-related metal-dependent hydrolase
VTPPRGHHLISNVALISADPDIGTVLGADIEIADGVIAAVGRDLVAPGAEVIDGSALIALPGFVETHFHMWSTIGKNFLQEEYEYFDAKHATHESYTPEDYTKSVRLGLIEAIDGGITTVHNWAHNAVSREHVEAELQAHSEIPVRARYSFGFRDSSPASQMIDFAALDAVRADWFGEADAFDGLVHLGVNMRPSLDREVFLAEVAQTRRRGLPIATHNGQRVELPLGAAELERLGLLGPDFLLCHGLPFEQEDREAMVRAGASMSMSPHSEMRGGSGGRFHEQAVHMPAMGINVALSIDAASLAPIDMFEAMRIIWNLGIPWKGTDTEELPALVYRDVIAMATINGARALGIDDLVGSITPGKRADVVLVRSDDLNMLPAFDVESAIVRNAKNSNVDTVFVDGRVLKRGGQLEGVDVAAITADAIATAEAVRSRATGERLATPPQRPGPMFG